MYRQLSDFVPGYEASTWFGIGAPNNTPVEIVDRLNKEINVGLADPGTIQARFGRHRRIGLAGFRRRIPPNSSRMKPKNGAKLSGSANITLME